MKRFRNWLLLCSLLLLAAAPCLAQDRSYQEGPVVIVTSVKVVDGQFENYMSYLAANWASGDGCIEEGRPTRSSVRRRTTRTSRISTWW